MTINKRLGKHTINFATPISISAFASVVGPLEKKGPLGDYFQYTMEDNYDGEMSWEKSEQKMMQHALEIALAKRGYLSKDLDYFLAGDLLNQIICANFTARSLGVPFFGLYGACSTLVEGLILGSIIIDGGFGERVGVAASSHHETAERQLRFPTEMVVQRPMTAQWTVTGSGAYILEKNIGDVVITQGVVGKILDMGMANASDLGSAMAPAAADTIVQYFKDTQRNPQDIDLIVTGDLGNIGRILCEELVLQQGYDISKNFSECGVLIYDPSQDTHAGGSGCGCSASVLAGYLIPKLIEGSLNSIFIVGTGALLSPTSTQQGETIPSIAHGVVIQRK